MFMTLLLVAGVAAFIWLRWRHQHRGMLKAADQFPGPKAIPFLGNAMQFICSPEEQVVVIKKLMTDYGEIVKFWLGPDLNIIVSSPDELKILLTNSKLNFKGPVYKYMSDVLGGGILSGSGPTWRKHRKIANPNYSKRAVESYSQVFNEEVDLLIEELKKIPSTKQFDIYENIVKTTSYAVCRTLMGLTKKQTLNLPYLQELIDTSPGMYLLVYRRMTTWYLQIDPIFWISNDNKILKEFSYKLSKFGKAITKHRTEYLKSIGEDFKIEHMNMKEDDALSVVDRFLLSEELDQDELEKETFTIFTAGQEATAKIASYLLLMMAYHPDCQEKLYNEVRDVMGNADRDVTDDDLKRMPYLEMVFKEVCRLFPIGAILQRTVKEDIAISSGYLPAGCSLVIPIYHLQRDPRFWENPNAFDPERFSPEHMERGRPDAYIPFSLGPMDCLGRYYGTKLVKTMCTKVIREFELTSLDSYKDLRVFISISVFSVNGYHVMMKRRSNTNNK